MAERLAIFPLGSVLLPGSVLPLRLFEPRYLRFIAKVLAADAHLDARWLTFEDAFRSLERLLGDRSTRAAAPIELSGDPATLTFEVANALPITAYDKQRVLAARTPDARRELLLDAIETLATLVQGPETH